MKRTLFILISSVSFLLLSCRSVQIFTPETISDELRIFQGGKLEYHKDLPIITLSGSHYEMGLQYGVLLRDEYTKAIEKNKTIINAVKDSSPALLKPFVSALFKNQVNKKFLKHLPEIYREELQGIADGSGVPFSDVVFTAAGSGTLDLACTSLISKSDSSILLGKNLDWAPNFYGKMPVIVKYQPDDGYFSVSASLILMPMGVITGMNDKGLALSINFVSTYKDENPDGMPVFYLNREILSKAENMAQAESLLKQFGGIYSWLVSVISSTELTGKKYELTAKDISSLSVQSGETLYALNGFENEYMKSRYMPLLFSVNDINDSRTRLLDTLLSEKKYETVDDLLFLLGHDGYGINDYSSRFSTMGINHCGTISTTVLDPENYCMYFGYGCFYSAWSEISKIDFKTGQTEIWRDADPLISEKVLQYAEKWYPDFHTELFAGRGAGIAEKIKACPETNQFILYTLNQIREYDSESVDDEYFTGLLKQFCENEADSQYVWIIAGNYFFEKKDFSQAEKYLSKILESDITVPDEKVNAAVKLAEISKYRGKTEKYKLYISICREIIDKYRDQYLFTEEENSLYEEIR